jgi:hypothetical protein
MKALRTLTGAAGLVGVILAIPVFVVGAGLLAWSIGGDAELPTVRVETDANAFVARDIDGLWDSDQYRFTDADRAFLSIDGAEPLFVGVGPAGDVEAFLDSGESPGDQTFWVYASSDPTEIVDWNLATGNWAAVIMNADGTDGIDATVSGALPAGPIRLAGGILVSVGFVIGAIGSLVLAAAWSGRDRRAVAGAPATA